MDMNHTVMYEEDDAHSVNGAIIESNDDVESDAESVSSRPCSLIRQNAINAYLSHHEAGRILFENFTGKYSHMKLNDFNLKNFDNADIHLSIRSGALSGDKSVGDYIYEYLISIF
jgi:hypothetical protein